MLLANVRFLAGYRHAGPRARRAGRLRSCGARRPGELAELEAAGLARLAGPVRGAAPVVAWRAVRADLSRAAVGCHACWSAPRERRRRHGRPPVTGRHPPGLRRRAWTRWPAWTAGCVCCAGTGAGAGCGCTPRRCWPSPAPASGCRRGAPAAAGPLLDNLTGAEQDAAGRPARVTSGRLLTGYASGSPGRAARRAAAAVLTRRCRRLSRYQAKAAELGVSVRTVQRWVAALRQERRPGRDRRTAAASADAAGRGRRALAGHVPARCWPSTPRRPGRRRSWCCAGIGPAGSRARRGTVPSPDGAGRGGAGGADPRHQRVHRQHEGQAVDRRAARRAPTGGCAPTRPGEYVLLDTTRLDVFAMEPVTLRWVRRELTIAMDLYSPVHHRAAADPGIDQGGGRGAVLFEALRPRARGSHRRRAAALSRAAGPGGHAGRPGRAGAAAGGRRGDHRGGPRQDLPVGAPAERVRPAGHLGPARPAADRRPTRPRSSGSSGPCARGCWPRCPATRARTSTAAARTPRAARSSSWTSWSR